jgi:hypothetical protein
VSAEIRYITASRPEGPRPAGEVDLADLAEELVRIRRAVENLSATTKRIEERQADLEQAERCRRRLRP